MKKKYSLNFTLKYSLIIVLYFSSSFCLFAQVDLQRGLIACFPFSGNANDATGNGNNGTVANGPVLVNDRFNNPNCAYEFDGVDDYISIPPNNFKNPNYTYSLWANVKVLPSNGSNIAVWSIGNTDFPGAGDQFIMLGANYVNSVQSGWYAGGYNTVGGTTLKAVGSLPTINTWYHLAVTRDNAFVKFYVNGQLIGSVSTGGSAPRYGGTGGAVEAGIGRRAPTLGGQYFKGIIDDFSMYNRALSDVEIIAIYNNSNCLTLPLPTAQNASRCGNGTLTLTASGGNQYRWYDAQIGGTLLFTGDTYTTPLLNSSQSYYVSNFNGSVESERKAVSATLLPVPIAPIANDVSRCGNGTVTLTASGGKNYRWYADITSTNPINTGSSYITPFLSASTTYYVTNFDGSCESEKKTINAIIFPIPAKPSIRNDKSLTFCLGDSVILSAPDGFFAYQWSNGATTQSIKIKSAGSYTVYVTNDNNCNSPLSEPVIVVVNSIPVTLTANNVSHCGVGIVTLIASGGTNYRWYNDLSSTIPLSTSASYTTPILATTTTYYVSNFNGNCESSRIPVTLNISLNPAMPVIDNITHCGEGSVTLTATGGVNYRWYSDVASAMPIGYDSFFNTPILNESITYYVANFDGTCESARKAVYVNILNLPQKPVIEANGPTTICQGEKVVLTAPSGYSNYQWSNGANTQYIEVFEPGNYTVKITNASGCESIPSEPILIDVPNNILPSVEIDVKENTICSDSLITFIAKPINGGQKPLYQWKVNGIEQGSPNDSSLFSFSFSKSDQLAQVEIGVEMISTFSCAEPKVVKTHKIITVYPNKHPQITIISVQDTVCSGQEISLSTQIINGGLNPTFQWKVNGIARGLPTVSTEFKFDTVNLSKNPIQIEVNVSLVTDEPCLALVSTSKWITIAPNPDIICMFTDTVEAKSRNIYQVKVDSGEPPYALTWNFGNEDIIKSQADTVGYIFTKPNDYLVSVKIVDRIGCESTCSKFIHVKPLINIPPNVFTPNGDEYNERFTIDYEGQERFEMTIYNRWGKPITSIYDGKQGWDGAGCATGLYFYTIKVEDKEFKGWIHLLR